MSLFIIDDNFLSNEEISQIEKEFYRLPSIFSERTLYVSPDKVEQENKIYSNRFMYCSYDGKENFTNKLALRILDKFCKKHNVKYDSIERTRSNTTFFCNETRPSVPHVDNQLEHLVLLYYVNNSDGDTVLYKNKYDENVNNEMIVDRRVSPKAGRAILFSGETYHSFYYPNIHDTRSVININIKSNGDINVG